MDCERFRISCRLDVIAAALEASGGLEVASLLISVAVAIGTVGTAVMSVVLLFRQTRLQESLVEKEARIRRAEYAAVLRAWILEAVSERAAGKRAGSSRRNEDSLEVARLGAQTGEASEGELAAVLATYLQLRLPAARDETGLGNAINETFQLVGQWVEDPSSVRLDAASVLMGHSLVEFPDP